MTVEQDVVRNQLEVGYVSCYERSLLSGVPVTACKDEDAGR